MGSKTFTVRQVTSLNDTEKEQTKAALGAAFEKYNFTNVVTNKDVEFTGDFCYSTVIAGLLGGEVYVAEDDDTKQIVGAAVWFPPKREIYDTEDQQEQALSILMARFSDELRGWWLQDFLPKYEKFTTSVLGEGTKKNSWHLQIIGVHPNFWRHGIAKALITTGIKKAEAEGSPMCLEVESQIHINMYAQLGFKSKGHTLFKGIPDAGEFVMWVMTKESTADELAA